MSGMEFGERDLMPGEQMTGATEWEDALIKHNIMPAKEVQKNEDDLYQEDVERKQQHDPHADKSLAELDELEDELEDNVIAGYRAARIAQMKEAARLAVHGGVYTVREQDFVAEVSKAPKGTYVVLQLWASTEPECQQLDKHMQVVANKFPAVKFCKIRAVEAIHNFPNHKCPTILVYYNGNIIKQIEKLGVFGGARISPASIEWVLAQPFTVRPARDVEDTTHMILQTKLTENPLNVANKLNLQKKKINKSKGYSSDEASDDED